MALSVDIAAPNAGIGKTVSIVVNSDARGGITVSCFFDNPPPPGFGPCAECRVYVFGKGMTTVEIPITEASWGGRSGRLQFELTNTHGDRLEAAVAIFAEPMPA